MEVPPPGPSFPLQRPPWWLVFHQTPDVPEAHTDKFIAVLCVVSEQNSFPPSEGIYHYVGNPTEQ